MNILESFHRPGEVISGVIAVLVIAAFIVMASERLGTVPLPETDEAHMLNMSYEMVYRGQLSRPMYRYLGGNIENAWHSLTPVYYVLVGGFQKAFGWGVFQGRQFNLIFAALVLLLTWLIGLRMFNSRVGLIAIVMLIGDQTFFERGRLLRNDFPAAAFAMLAFFLFIGALKTSQLRYYIASGLTAGAAVMCHTNCLYMFFGIGLLILFTSGWRGLRSKHFYCYALSALAVMSYEIVFTLADYTNFTMQYRDDKLHFGILERWGFMKNALEEPRRYEAWLRGGEMFLNVPRTTLFVFQLLVALAVVYLIVRFMADWKRLHSTQTARGRLLLITIVAVLFHAVVASHKEIYYLVHIVPWLALAVGVMLDDALALALGMRGKRWKFASPAYGVALAVSAILALSFALQTARQYRRYLREAGNPQLARFDEIKGVLRGSLPEGVCPVAIKSPVMFLAFPEHDRCFASIETRMKDALDIDGNEYAVIVPSPYGQVRSSWTEELEAKHPLIAELADTAYGTINIYYTGANPEYRSMPTRRTYFFGDRRGHVSEEQLAAAREVWSADGNELRWAMASPVSGEGGSLMVTPPPHSGLVVLATVQLEPGTGYEFEINSVASQTGWQFLLLNDSASTVLKQDLIKPGREKAGGLFSTTESGTVKIALQHFQRSKDDALNVNRITIREIGEVK